MWPFERRPALSLDALMNRARQEFATGEFTKALRDAEELLSKAPNVALSWRFKGECLFSLGSLKKLRTRSWRPLE
jgi:hypothetical protein